MKKTDIILSWIEEGTKYEREVNRQNFYDMFYGLSKGFEWIGDNEISKKMIKIVPDVDEILIYKDFNETQDVPSIVYIIGNERRLIKISRKNDVVWGILKKQCAIPEKK